MIMPTGKSGHKKTPGINAQVFRIGYVLLSQEAALQVLSAMQGLTSVFGMGTGVSPTLLQPY